MCVVTCIQQGLCFKGVIEFDLFDKYYVIVNEKQLEGRYVAAKLTLDFLTH